MDCRPGFLDALIKFSVRVLLTSFVGVSATNAAELAQRPEMGNTNGPRGIYLYTETPIEGDHQFNEALNVRGPNGDDRILDGMAVVLDWATIEPHKDDYDFHSADFQIDEALKANLAIELVIRAGSRTPAWLLPTQQLKLIYSPHNGVGKCSDVNMPPPWLSDYTDAFALMLKKTVEHFTLRGANIEVVKLTGLNTTTEELRLPAEEKSKTAGKPCQNAGADDVQVWKQAGYKDALVVKAFGELTSDFSNLFPKTPVTLAIIPHGGFPPIESDTGKGPHEKMVRQLVGDAAKRLGNRFILQYDLLLAGKPVKSEVMQLATSNKVPVAWQTNLWRGGIDAPGGGKEGAACGGEPGGKPGTKPGPVQPCSDAEYLSLLNAGIHPAGGAGPNLVGRYIEVFPYDVIEHPGPIKQAHADLTGTALPPHINPTPHCDPGVKCPKPE